MKVPTFKGYKRIKVGSLIKSNYKICLKGTDWPLKNTLCRTKDKIKHQFYDENWYYKPL